jgi:hypothetical protein
MRHGELLTEESSQTYPAAKLNDHEVVRHVGLIVIGMWHPIDHTSVLSSIDGLILPMSSYKRHTSGSVAVPQKNRCPSKLVKVI